MCRSNALQMPEWEAGYNEWTSYFLGDRLFVPPVCQPGTMRRVVLPPGRWVNTLTRQLVHSDGETARTVTAPFMEAPLHYVRAGSLVVKQPYVHRASRLPETLCLEIYPDARDWDDRFVLYEDDGLSRDFERGMHALQKYEVRQESGTVTLRIAAREGDFASAVDQRSFVVQVVGGIVDSCICDGVGMASECDNAPALPPLDMRVDHEVVLSVRRLPAYDMAASSVESN